MTIESVQCGNCADFITPADDYEPNSIGDCGSFRAGVKAGATPEQINKASQARDARKIFMPYINRYCRVFKPK